MYQLSLNRFFINYIFIIYLFDIINLCNFSMISIKLEIFWNNLFGRKGVYRKPCGLTGRASARAAFHSSDRFRTKNRVNKAKFRYSLLSPD